MARQRLRASTEKTRPSIFWPLAVLVAPLISLVVKLEIEGAEKIPREGAYVLAPNHYSEFDPLAVALAVWKMGRAPRFMAKESLFRIPVLGSILRGGPPGGGPPPPPPPPHPANPTHTEKQLKQNAHK
ncbi:MAG: lysophospholipid acyltransferase family protein [Microbacterium sp.]